MKLYTEEQVRQAMQDAMIPSIYQMDLWGQLTPIELPSEEEIDKESVERWKPLAFRGGVRWVIEHIKNQVTP